MNASKILAALLLLGPAAAALASYDGAASVGYRSRFSVQDSGGDTLGSATKRGRGSIGVSAQGPAVLSAGFLLRPGYLQPLPTPSSTSTPTFIAASSATLTASYTPSSSATASRTRSPTPTATPTSTPSRTISSTLSATPTQTVSSTVSASPTATPSRTASPTPTATPSRTASPTPTATPSRTASATPTATASSTASASSTATLTASFTATLTASSTATLTASSTATLTASSTAALTASSTTTLTASSTATETSTASPSSSATLTASSTPSSTATATGTPFAQLQLDLQASPAFVSSAGDIITFVLTLQNNGGLAATDLTLWDTVPPNATYLSDSGGAVLNGSLLSWSLASLAPSASVSFSFSASFTGSGTQVDDQASVDATDHAQLDSNAVHVGVAQPLTATQTPSSTETASSSPSATGSPTDSPTGTPTQSPTASSTPTPTAMDTATGTETPTLTGTMTPTGTQTATETETGTQTETQTGTQTGTQTETQSGTQTETQTRTQTETQTETQTGTQTGTQTPTLTVTATLTGTASCTATVTPSETATSTASPTQSPTETLSSSATLTASSTVTASPTSTATGSPTPTPTESPTASSTASPSSSSSATLTASSTPTPSATQTPQAPGLSVVKSVAETQAYQDSLIHYSIVVSNAGPGLAQGIQVYDSLPEGANFFGPASVQGDSYGSNDAWRFTDTLALARGPFDLGVGQSFTVNLVVKLALPSPGENLSNTAQAVDALFGQSAFGSAYVPMLAGAASPTASPTPSPVLSPTPSPFQTPLPPPLQLSFVRDQGQAWVGGTDFRFSINIANSGPAVSDLVLQFNSDLDNQNQFLDFLEPNTLLGPADPMSPVAWRLSSVGIDDGVDMGVLGVAANASLTSPRRIFTTVMGGQGTTLTSQVVLSSASLGLAITATVQTYINAGPPSTPVALMLPSDTPTPVAGLGRIVAYPQPARDHVCFAFGAPAAGELRILVYNAAFQLVAELKNPAAGADTQDACADVSGMAAGVYFYRATVGDYAFPTGQFGIAR